MTNTFLNNVYNMSAEDFIPHIPDESLDLIVTSPPYNVDLGNNKYRKKGYDEYRDNKDHDEYITWLTSLFDDLYPKIREGGRVCINIGDGKNGKIPTHSDVIQFMTHTLEYNSFSTIVWDKKNVSSRTAWGSWLSPSSPSFPTPFEYILIFSKGTKKLQTSGVTDLTKDEFIDYAYGIWTFKPETEIMKTYDHPAPFPEELPKRCIKMLTWKGATVYDPFGGIGTTGVVAKKLQRNYLLTDTSEEYCYMAKQRINNE